MLKGLMSFDHVPHGTIGNPANLDATGNLLPQMNGYGFIQDPSIVGGVNATNFATGAMVDADGIWMATEIGANVTAGQFAQRGFAIPLWRIMDLTTVASYIGFRMKMAALVTTGTATTFYTPTTGNVPYVWIGSSTGLVVGGVLNLLNTSNLPNANLVLGQAVFIEIKLDRVASLITVWMDGIQISQVAWTPTILNAGLNLIFGYTGTYTSSQTTVGSCVQFKDLYFVDNTSDANVPNGRLGSQLSKLLPLLTATGTGWTSSDSKTLIADLQTVVTSAATLAAPLITSPAGATPTELDFTVDSSSIPAGSVINGMDVVIGGARLQGTGTELKVSAKDAATPTPNVKSLGSTKFLGANNIVGRMKTGNLILAPDGTALTPAKIAAMTFIAQPALPTTFAG